MFPIPDPSRLFPRKSPPSAGSGRRSAISDLLALASFPMMLAGTIAAGALGAKLTPWLAIPAGFVGLALTMALLESLILCGIVEAVFYSAVTFVFSGGLDEANPRPNLIAAILVAALFLYATYSAWRKGDR